jgi:hypothetical protein
VLYQIHNRTRDETFTTDQLDNALRFFVTYEARHHGHVIEFWRQRLDGRWEQVGVGA